MLNHVKTYLEYDNRFCGIEHTSQNGKEVYFTTLLKKNKSALDIENVYEETSIQNIIPNLPKKQHICLIVNNDNVLTKRIEGLETDTFKAVYKAFPNINLDDFYYEVIKQHKNLFVSICRKTYVDELINNYTQHGFSIINITFGNSIISGISSFLKDEKTTTSNAFVFFENQTISIIKKTEADEKTKYNINGLEITNNHLLSSAGALNTLINNFNPTTNFDNLKISLNSNYKQSQFYKIFIKFGLILILTMLLVNFFVFNHYFNKVKTLQQTSQINQTTKQKIITLNESVSKSQKMVEDMLKGNSSKSSFYVNTLVQSLPNSILLSELNYQPVIKRIKAEQQINIDVNSILLSGKSNNSDVFSNWLNEIENTNWINKVEILSYEDFSKSSSKFSLKLSLNND